MYNFKWAVVILFQALYYGLLLYVSARDLEMQYPLEHIFVCFFKARFSIEPITFQLTPLPQICLPSTSV